MKRCLTLLALVASVFVLGAVSLSAQEAEKDFVSIFNGKDLSGWTGDERFWAVEDGCIVGRTFEEPELKIDYNHSLAWKDEVSDFVIRFDYRITEQGNSGLYYRGWYLDPEGHPYQMGGYQADFDGNATYAGINYGEHLRGIIANLGTISFLDDSHNPTILDQFAPADDLRKSIKVEDWNSYEIIVKDYVFIHKINGKIRSILIDEDEEVRRASGPLAIQIHVGPPMKVELKNIRLKTL